MKHKELAEQAGIGYLYEYEMKWAWLGELERFAELVRADEREACAVLCEKMSKSTWTFCNFAEAIRARGDE